MTDWKSVHVPTDDGFTIAAFEAGEGSPVVFINGGPGDDHSYLRAVAAPLTGNYRCVLYDQRGCGNTVVAPLDATTINLNTFMADLLALHTHLNQGPLMLVGHSWGAMLAVVFAAFFPHQVRKLIPVSLGPMTVEMGHQATANTLKSLNAEERADYHRMRAARKQATAEGDLTTAAVYHYETMRRYTTRAWIYKPEERDRFAEEWWANYNYNPALAPLLMAELRAMDVYAMVEGLTVPTLFLYGAQDYCPVAQGYELAMRMADARVQLINECGHEPWLDQPEAFYGALRKFL